MALAIGIGLTLLAVVIQSVAVSVALRVLVITRGRGLAGVGYLKDLGILVVVVVIQFAGLLIQITVWAAVFAALGEFAEFGTAFYHSTVNFAALGYGDIVMSETWRLLGALQALSGLIMFGIVTGLMVAFMTRLGQWRHGDVFETRDDK